MAQNSVYIYVKIRHGRILGKTKPKIRKPKKNYRIELVDMPTFNKRRITFEITDGLTSNK